MLLHKPRGQYTLNNFCLWYMLKTILESWCWFFEVINIMYLTIDGLLSNDGSLLWKMAKSSVCMSSYYGQSIKKWPSDYIAFRWDRVHKHSSNGFFGLPIFQNIWFLSSYIVWFICLDNPHPQAYLHDKCL